MRRDEENAVCDRAFCDDTREGVVLQKPIDDRIRDLITQFVWMAFRDRLAGKDKLLAHGGFLFAR
jgi:hypothetical protein